MTNAKMQQFLERLIAAGKDGIDLSTITEQAELEFMGELNHDGNTLVREHTGTKQRFLVARYGAHEALYILRGWASRTRDGLLITEQGSRHLKLALLTNEDR